MSDGSRASCMRGIVAMFDDQIRSEGTVAFDLANHLEKSGFPCLRYVQRPTEYQSQLNGLHGCSFFVLDWSFDQDEDNDVKIGQETLDGLLIQSLQALHGVRHAPVFVFTQQGAEALRERIEQRDSSVVAYTIFKDKSEVRTGGAEFIESVLEEWLENNVAAHVFYEWQGQLWATINELSLELFSREPIWPRVMATAYERDLLPVDVALSEMLGTIVMNRVGALNLNNGLKDALAIAQTDDDSSSALDDKEIAREIIRFERFVPDKKLPHEPRCCGDIFETIEGKKRLYLNISPTCDSIVRNDKPKEITLIRVKDVPHKDLIKEGRILSEGARINDRANHCTILGVFGDKALQAQFNEVIRDTAPPKTYQRIGRLLSPYITHVQNEFALYSLRVGHLRLPKELLPDVD